VLTPEEVQLGYWGARRVAGLLPRNVQDPGQITDPHEVGVWLPAGRPQSLVKAWCKVLPQLPVKTLVFECQVNQALLEAAAQITGLEALYIKWGSIKDLSPIANCQSITALDIGSSPSLTGLTTLTNLPSLRCFRLENVREAHDISFAAGCPGLGEFGAGGSMYTELKIDHLWPLRECQKLELVWLISASVRRDGLRPLYGLPRLTTLKSSFLFKAADFAGLRHSTPSLRYGTPFDPELIAMHP
jgi:hypothetical protein